MVDKKVSVIIPIYNAAQYLHKCLKSVISQTYKNLDIILIDDGSLDDSYDIAKEYQEKDSFYTDEYWFDCYSEKRN